MFFLIAIPLVALALVLVIVETAQVGRFMARHPSHELACADRFIEHQVGCPLIEADIHFWLAVALVALLLLEVTLVALQVQAAPSHLINLRLRYVHWAFDAGAIGMLIGALFCNGRSARREWHKFFVYPFIILLACSMVTGAMLEYPFYTGFR